MFRKKKTLSLMLFSLIVLAIFFLSAMAPRAYALAHSSKVAYVTDFGAMSVCAPDFRNSSIFVNAFTGAPPAGCPNAPTYTTTGGNTVTFTDVTVAAIDAGGLAAISGFDTVLLYEVCDIASHPATMTALNVYLTAGDGKVVIYDSDMCYGATIPNYSTFLFPFTTSNPGPGGFPGTPTFIETESSPAVLTRSLAGILTNDTDAIGDSNTFVANNPAWCAAEEGPNGKGAVGIQIGYARTAAGGLAIYDGNDNWSTISQANGWDAQAFSNILDQPFNPDGLPCGRVATGITVTPGTATNPVGSSHTVTATVLNNTGAPLAGVTVTFKVTSGPNAGKTGTCVTNTAGQCTFTYSGTAGAGTDNIIATFTDATGTLHSSNNATKTWGTGCTNTTVTVTTTAKVTVFVTQPPTAAVTVFVTQPLPCNGPGCTSQSTITTAATVTGTILVLSLVGLFLVLFVIALLMIRRKVRCRYCRKWFDERLSRCPRCGAPA